MVLVMFFETGNFFFFGGVILYTYICNFTFCLGILILSGS